MTPKALVENGTITPILYPRAVTIGNVQHGANIFTDMTRAQLRKIGIYPLVLASAPAAYHTVGKVTYAKVVNQVIESRTDTPMTLSEVKAQKKADLSMGYQTALMGNTVTYKGSTFQADQDSIRALTETLTAVNSGWTLPTSFMWIDSANIPHPADVVFLKGLASAMADSKTALFAGLQIAKSNVTAAADIASVIAI